MIPGEIITLPGDIELNKGAIEIQLQVSMLVTDQYR